MEDSRWFMLFSSIAIHLKHNKLTGLIKDRETLLQIKKYLLTGISTFALEYTIFLVLFRAAGLWYILSNTIAYVFSFWYNFLMNRYWSFKSKGSLKRQLLIYMVLFVFNIWATNSLLYILSDIAGITPLLSKVLIMGAVVCWNFLFYKKVIYK